MNKLFHINSLLLTVLAISLYACKKDYGNLNSPTVESFLKNANKDQLNNLVSGTESAMRINVGLYLDDVGVIGREIYRFSTGDPRYTTDLLGATDAALDNTGFYLINTWASRYRIVKNCNLLIDAAASSASITDAERKGYSGFAKTIMAHELLLNLNLTNANGIRVDVANPDRLGPLLNNTDALTAIAALLDDAKTDLGSGEVSFPLSSGFTGFGDAAGLNKLNRALAARVAVYRKDWPGALDALEGSFFDIDGDFTTGLYDVFGTGSGDQLNPAFFPPNQNGDVRLAHPTYVTDMEPNDDRISKARQRNEPASYQALTSDRDAWVYTSSTAPIPVIRNEELILIYAEASIQSNSLSEGEMAINKIRNGHHLPNYSGAADKDALITEMLRQRRYSLFFEGHRWVDLRRYDRLSELRADRTGDDVWSSFPIPSAE